MTDPDVVPGIRTGLPTGSRPFWAPGEVIRWHYRRPRWVPGMPETAFPVRVVRDDPSGLVVWLAGGTRGLGVRRIDGNNLRADKSTMFSAQRKQVIDEWWGSGIVRIAATGEPWSVWIFHWDVGTPQQRHSWYVNLEDPLRRDGNAVFSSDRVLDLIISPQGHHRMKDEDELEQAVWQGRFTDAEADSYRTDADAALAAFRNHVWPFDNEWVNWEPPTDWPVPDLPAEWQHWPNAVGDSATPTPTFPAKSS